MTLSTATNSHPLRRRGFTLVEMMVVIGITLTVMAFLLPAVNNSYKRAIRTRMHMDIQAITMALDAYRADQRDYPRIDYNDTTTGLMTGPYPGATVLCWALMGLGTKAEDGHDGTGFTVLPRGQVYGPYLDSSHFKVIQAGLPPGTVPTDLNSQLADRYGHPVLYFKANTLANIYVANGFVDNWAPGSTNPRPMYNLYDNLTLASPPALKWATDSATEALSRMRLMLGDKNADGMIDPSTGENAVTTASYLLWLPGPDEKYGPDMTLANYKETVPALDDVTSFR